MTDRNEIIGIVDKNGIRECIMDYGTRKEHLISIKIYYEKGNEPFSIYRPEYMILQCPFDQKIFNDLSKTISPFSVISASIPTLIRLSSVRELKEETYRFNIQILSSNRHHELAEKLQKKISFSSRIFGEFSYDTSVYWYETTTKWLDNEIILNLIPNKMDDVEPAHKFAAELFKKNIQKNVGSIYRKKIIDELFDDIWVEPETELSKTKFFNSLKLESIVVGSDGSLEFWFNDGGLFGEHSIRVYGKIGEYDFNVGLEG